MTLNELFTAVAKLSGMSLTKSQIIQPLKNVRVVVLALLANFVLVPLLVVAELQIAYFLLCHLATLLPYPLRFVRVRYLAMKTGLFERPFSRQMI